MNVTDGQSRIYTDQNEPLKPSSVRLPFWHVREARRIGKGNLSEGIRIALEFFKINGGRVSA